MNRRTFLKWLGLGAAVLPVALVVRERGETAPEALVQGGGPSRAAIHCADCSDLREIENPQGWIVLNQLATFGDDTTTYHLTVHNTGLTTVSTLTRCGLDAQTFDSRIGTLGMELADWELSHEWLRYRDACPDCFMFVRRVHA